MKTTSKFHEAVRVKVAQQVAEILEPYLGTLEGLKRIIESPAALSASPGFRNAGNACTPARTTQTAGLRAERSLRLAWARVGVVEDGHCAARVPGSPKIQQDPPVGREGAAAVALRPAHPSPAIARESAAPPAAKVAARAEINVISVVAPAAPRAMATTAAPPASAAPPSDTRSFSIDQPVRIRRPHGFAEATVIQIDPSTGLLELELAEDGRYVKLPAEKVFAAGPEA